STPERVAEREAKIKMYCDADKKLLKGSYEVVVEQDPKSSYFCSGLRFQECRSATGRRYVVTVYRGEEFRRYKGKHQFIGSSTGRKLHRVNLALAARKAPKPRSAISWRVHQTGYRRQLLPCVIARH
ncbi:MAG: hypothetical protein WAR76_18280, partial [Xanthobacteraceae bacterium]